MTDDTRTREDLLSELVMLRGRVAELEAREAIPDTSEKKTAEEALRESEEKYRVVVQKAHEGILVAQKRNAPVRESRDGQNLGIQ